MSSDIRIRTTRSVTPMIYAYTTPEIKRHEGWTKIGYTEQDVDERIKQQTHTADVEYHEEWRGNAIFEDGSGDIFTDKDFHAYLIKNDVEQEEGKNNEWFRISGNESRGLFYDFKSNRGILKSNGTIPYELRDEQSRAVSLAYDYFKSNPNGEFLWNAKPRFGKTLTTYHLAKTMDAKNVLVVTNRPAIANSWYEDYCKYLGDASGYKFVTEIDSLQKEKHVLRREEFDRLRNNDSNIRCIEFLSLQNLKGSIHFGGKYDKLRHIKQQPWDLLVIDEAHEGVDTYKTDVAFDRINRKWTLHLSGTPFKALANSKFPDNAIFNWTYADEQEAKSKHEENLAEDNPYANLPKLSMFTYRISDIVEEDIKKGMAVDEEMVNYAFDLNEFFSTGKNGRFVHEESVDRFLESLTTNEKFPFSTEELRNELKHTFWLLDRVDSAKAMYNKLKAHPVFKDYEIVLAAGDGKVDDEGENTKAFDKVKRAVSNFDRTITLSVGQLTTGITIPEWSAVLILSNVKSPALYMQAAFRAQNPCLYKSGTGRYLRKENAYVFDFDPARSLEIFESFANDLSSDTASGKGDSDSRKKRVRFLLNFFPVIGEDEDGKMVELDAERVLSIPRQIRSIEVVRRGFMSDFLFQNINNIFHAPQLVVDLIKSLPSAKTPEGVNPYYIGEVEIDEYGNPIIPKDIVIGEAKELFGDKKYGVDEQATDDIFAGAEKWITEKTEEDDIVKKLMNEFKTDVSAPIMEKAREKYGTTLTKSSEKTLQRKFNFDVETEIKKAVSNLKINQQELKLEMEKEMDASKSDSEREAIEKKYDEKRETGIQSFKMTLNQSIDDLIENAKIEIVDRAKTDETTAKKKTIEDNVKDHLRGFSRTIPSFLMAYGTENDITLSNIDSIVPEDVFKDVTSITIDDFRFLRDGGDYIDEETGETKHYEGHLFDEVVFDDSVKEFMSLKKRLADYFDESAVGDIFDYIPPQKTNQIFTPKNVVKDMVDMLEKENPGCFDDENNTFADLYMKSGQYIAEIVRRLYRSNRLKQLFPDENDRLNHIFSKQVYGLAPTEIIERIVKSYLLGFSDDIKIEKHNIRLCDSLKLAKNGNMDETLRAIFNNL